MTGRPHSERLLADLAEIRQELVGEVEKIPPAQMDWAPSAGMKSYKSLLQEIGAMEALSIGWILSGKVGDWEEASNSIAGDSPASALASLEKVRSETGQYLAQVSEEELETPIPTPESWQPYFGSQMEPEEIIRWITRHEYYHLGQIIIYLWIQGRNPYEKE